MRASHVVALGVAALVLAAIVASRTELGDGTGGSAAPAPAGTTAATRSVGPEPSADPTPPHRRSVVVAGVDLEITAAEVTVGDQRADGTRTITTSGAPAYGTGTPGAEVTEHGDRSVTVLRDGTPVAALTPAARGEKTAGGTGSPSRGATVLTLGDDALDSTAWAQREGEGGLSLAVVPASWVRGGGEATLDLLAAQLAGAEPETDSDTMRDQLACHHLGAPDKASWNLEPWRPDVGMFGTIAARCNPTDS